MQNKHANLIIMIYDLKHSPSLPSPSPLPPPPLHQNEVVCLPLKLSRSLGHMFQVVLCTRVTTSLHITDPQSLQGEETWLGWCDKYAVLAHHCLLILCLTLQLVTCKHRFTQFGNLIPTYASLQTKKGVYVTLNVWRIGESSVDTRAKYTLQGRETELGQLLALPLPFLSLSQL